MMKHRSVRKIARVAFAVLGFSMAASPLGALLSESNEITASAASLTPLKLDDFRTAVGISDVTAGACGRVIAFVTRANDYDSDTSVSTLRVLDTVTNRITTISRRGDDVGSPAWSPDGSELAFIATPGKAEAKPGGDDPAADRGQIAVVSRASLAPAFVTHEKRGVQGFAWRPDGRAFAYLTKDEAPNQKAIDAHDDAFEVRDNQWTLGAEPVPNHLWTIARDGSHAHRVTSGTFSLQGTPVFAHDGASVLITRYPSAFTQHYRERRLVRVDLRSGTIVPVVANETADGPVFSRDGKHLAYAIPNIASFSVADAVLANADGSGASDVSQRLDRAVLDLKFDSDNQTLLALTHDATRAKLYRISRSGAKALDAGDLNVADYDADCSGRLYFAASSPLSAAELYSLDPGAAPHRITHFNDALTHHAIAPSQTVYWSGAGGFEDDGVLTTPIGVAPGAKAPLVLLIHGGPTSTSTTSFSELAQLLAAHGWYVFQPNYRGSDNLGARFAQATVPHITSAPGQDVEDGLAAVIAHFPIDTARIGVSGWSEGGLLTSWLITHDTRWKAAMSGAAVNDWLMYRDLTDSQDFTPNFITPTSPFVDDKTRELYRNESPLTFADRVKTPTLIMTDAGDQRVPTPLAYAFYHAVRQTGTPVKMVVIPADGHFPTDPIRVEDVYRRWVGWFADKL